MHVAGCGQRRFFGQNLFFNRWNQFIDDEMPFTILYILRGDFATASPFFRGCPILRGGLSFAASRLKIIHCAFTMRENLDVAAYGRHQQLVESTMFEQISVIAETFHDKAATAGHQ